MLPQLRRFSYHHPKEAAAQITTAAILSLLGKTPSLERLEIHVHTLASSDDTCMAIDLPDLTFISYTADELAEPSMLRFIHYPPSARVKFMIHGTQPLSTLCKDELSAMISHMGSGGVTAAIDFLSLSTYFSNFSMMARIGQETVLDLYVSSATILDDVTPLFKLSNMLPSGIRELRIGGLTSLRKEDRGIFSRRHLQVQTLFCSEVDTSFIRSLWRPPGSGQLPFQELKILHLYNCEIKRASFIAALERFLKERLNSSSPLDLLKIGSCRITKDILRHIEAYVKVEWDGHERFIDDYSNGEESEDGDGDGEEEEDDD
ncbi:hypothetical protein EYR36_008774 [Pleurotus pulmonarius]|nr:hypothetical protein EYR36_008774 [Pleurotus pulmonarius]